MNIMQKLLVTIQCQMYSLHSAKEGKNNQQHDNLKKHLQNEKEKYANKSNIKKINKITTTTWKFI